MAATIITLEDLHSFKTELLYDISQLFNPGQQSKPASKWLKSKDVRQLLKISPGHFKTYALTASFPVPALVVLSIMLRRIFIIS